ncbi:hypothetical protein [Rhizobium sp. G21]|uniref:hypothetical protein n=1 Tax=Rhizobium sp. G21 TaxID=2758439 RepID=UPI001603B8BA|nr:hypothetical protein [Rhizobium sp. G21]MBB1248117.1 hypothetical protein [Rhizobium sp. G21]
MADDHRDRLDKRVLLTGACFCFVAMFAAVAFPRSEFVVVVTRPGADPAALLRIIGDAGGTLVSSTRVDWVGIAHSDDRNFAGRLFQSGAALVLDHALAAGCKEGK